MMMNKDELREKIIENMDTMLTSESQKALERELAKVLKKNGIPFTISHLEAFLEGVSFVTAHKHSVPLVDNPDAPITAAMMMVGVLMKIIDDKKKQLAKFNEQN